MNMKLACVLIVPLIITGVYTLELLNDSSPLIQMKNTSSTRQDDLRCTYFKLEENSRQYITEFIPRVRKHVAHHMVLFGCKRPAMLNIDDWYCGPNGVGICEKENESMESDQIVYAWAMEADGFKFPSDVGYRIGGDTDVKYLVLQMHYKKKFNQNEQDNSGLELKITKKELSFQVGYYILGNYGYIPPHEESFLMESGCYYNLPFDIYPIAYRTHGHNLAEMISGYLIREDVFIEIGRMSPKQPQMFYNTSTSNLKISRDDLLIAHCIMNSTSREQITKIGTRNEDEMCNFYIMYYTSFKDTIKNTFCFKNAQEFSWKDTLSLTDIPKNAYNLEGVHLISHEMDGETE